MSLSRSAVYAKSLVEAWEQSSSQQKKSLLDHFVSQLEIDHTTPLATSIIAAVEQEMADREARKRAVVETAHTHVITAKQLEKFGDTKVEHVPDVVGGFRVTAQGQVVDATVSGALRQMKRELARE